MTGTSVGKRGVRQPFPSEIPPSENGHVELWALSKDCPEGPQFCSGVKRYGDDEEEDDDDDDDDDNDNEEEQKVSTRQEETAGFLRRLLTSEKSS